MKLESTLVKDLMQQSPIFVYEKSTLSIALKTMEKFRVEILPIVKKDFSVKGIVRKKDILKILAQKNNQEERLNELFVESLLKEPDKISSICVYPSMDIREVYQTMIKFNLREIPVIDFLWDKKLLGYICLNDIKKVFDLMITR
ncbi:MAG: CBS domain-containing protein [Candidatus Gastranaerophilales bacterium]|nr:CBS domain-containing protein [Candidatus Gastranaerophilales bacterium]